MPRYVAFLRAVNVGGHTVKMDYLRSLFEGIGLSNVETFIASGNVIFDSTSRSEKTLEKKIEAHLQKTLGYAVTTFVRSLAELTVTADYKPFANAERVGKETSVYIAFMADEPDEKAKQRVLALSNEFDEFHIRGRELYWLCRKKFSESDISGAMLAKGLGVQSTIRNSTTIKKIVSKYA